MKIKTFASAAVMGALGLLIPLHSSAFGLGKIELSSALNEPLNAVVPITALRVEDNATFQVRLASNDEFHKAGLKRTFLLTQLKFEVVNKDGKSEVHITSEQPVKEPFLDFLLIASTANGRLIREYTVLLDPPKNVFTKPQAPVKQTTKQKAPQKSAVQPATASTQTRSSQPLTSSYSSDTYHVKSTDTLYNVAKKVRPQSDISINQMMMALLDSNQSAFINSNINQLKANSTLTVPSVEEIKKRSKRQALLDVNQQNEAWRNRNRVVTSTASDESRAESVAQNDEQAVYEPASQNDDEMTRLDLIAPGDDVLEEVGESSALGDPKIKELTEQLTLAQETIESQAQENNDIKSRMDMMEEQLQTLRRLISLKDADLAKVQNNLYTEQAEEAIESELTADAVDSEINTTVDDAINNMDMSADEMLASTSTDADSEINSLEDSSVVDDNAEAMSDELMAEDDVTDIIGAEDVTEPFGSSTVENSNEDMSSTVIVDDEVTDSTSTDDTVMPEDEEGESSDSSDNSQADDAASSVKLPLEVAGETVSGGLDSIKNFYASHRMESLLGGLVALLALIWLAIRGRRDDSEDYQEVQEQSVTVTPPQYVAPVNNEIEQAAPAQEEVQTESFTPEVEEVETEVVEQSDSLNIDAEPEPEIEPVFEQLDEAAEETADLNSDLIDTVEDLEEDDHLEFNLDDYKEDNSQAEQTTDAEIEVDSHADDDLLDFNIDDSQSNDDSTDEIEVTEEPVENDALDFGEPLSLDTESLDTELELNDEPLSLDTDESQSADLELNIEETDLEEALSITPEAIEDVAEMEDEALSIDLLEDELSNNDSDALDVQAEDDVSFDLGEFDGIDEAETKLDLAAAYMDMGDPEGARSILEEVMNDGNDEQKSRAQELLNGLG